MSYEADPWHAEIDIGALGLKDAKGVVTPGAKEEGTTKDDHKTNLDEHLARKYEPIVACLNDLTPDRPDIAFVVKELARSMSSPSNGCEDTLKRSGRYRITTPRALIEFKWQVAQKKLKIYIDAGCAGCKATRESFSGGVVVLGQRAKHVEQDTTAPRSESRRERFLSSSKSISGMIRVDVSIQRLLL